MVWPFGCLLQNLQSGSLLISIWVVFCLLLVAEICVYSFDLLSIFYYFKQQTLCLCIVQDLAMRKLSVFKQTQLLLMASEFPVFKNGDVSPDAELVFTSLPPQHLTETPISYSFN